MDKQILEIFVQATSNIYTNKTFANEGCWCYFKITYKQIFRSW